MKKNHLKKRGQEAFTLIELLVVVAIIGLLSAVVMYSVTNARQKAIDTKEAEDMRQLEITANIRLLENVNIPNVLAFVPDDASSDVASAGRVAPSVESIVKYITMAPNTAEAAQAEYLLSAKYYKDLFSNGLFFKPGTPMPQAPQCINPTAPVPDPATCYRAYYNAADNILVIATTLSTKRHANGPNTNVQYGIAVGKGVSNATLANTCSAIGYPVFSTTVSYTSDYISACADPNGVSSIVQGVSTGRNIGGATGTGSI